MGEHRFKEIWECPPEKARRWCRAIQSATVKVLYDRPPLVSALGQAPLMLLPLRYRAMASFHSGGCPLKGLGALDGPRLPLLKHLGGPLRGDGLRVQRGRPPLQSLPKLGFPARATGVSHVMFPRDERQQAHVDPLPPRGREVEGLPIPLDTLPPEVHQSSQGRDLLADCGHGLATGR